MAFKCFLMISDLFSHLKGSKVYKGSLMGAVDLRLFTTGTIDEKVYQRQICKAPCLLLL